MWVDGRSERKTAGSQGILVSGAESVEVSCVGSQGWGMVRRYLGIDKDIR